MNKELAELREDLKSTIRQFEYKLTDIFNRIDKLEIFGSIIPIDELEISVRVVNVCRALNITTAQQLSELTANQLLRTGNFGKKSLEDVRQALAEYKMHLNGDEVAR